MERLLSFEVFPANTNDGFVKLVETVKALSELKPSFISVTCSNNNQSIEQTTIKIANYIHNELGIETIAHLPAAYLSKAQVKRVIDTLANLGIHQVLALRGDHLPNLPPLTDFSYASELITFIKEIAPDFTISGACYPEVHPDSPNRVADIKTLKLKCDAGCNRLITQLFFDNELFYEFVERCQLAEIDVPIIAGIMPIVNRKQAIRLVQTTKTKLPRKFLAILEKYEHNPQALREAGLAYAVDQIVDLLTQDVAGVHLYTMNNASVAQHIHQQTAALFQIAASFDQSFPQKH
ncbi:methylenetetrahydrofolate reductase [NAD(P)H] [Enterococcus camelliae]|uniref:Methylenetetrahydrofolate reductase n=1 Tax=Enterococcus camelliae TaxID=453959 RepID=A0ABW5TGU5_9ENTE